MRQRARSGVVFLDTPAGTTAGLAADRFNAVAGRMGLPWAATAEPVGSADLSSAVAVVAVDRAATEPAVRERFPDLADRVRYWPVGPDPAAIDRAVTDLVAVLLGGKPAADAPPEPPPPPKPKKPAATVKVSRETAGRRGKGVTVVSEVPLGEDGLRELAAALKQKCGTGGTAKDGRIEIQGDHRDRLTSELEKLGYKVKRSGG